MVETFNEIEVREPPIQIAGRFLGIVVFLVGIAMLGLAFSLSYRAFNEPDMLISMQDLSSESTTLPLVVWVRVLLKLILLFAMGYIGSLVAGRGAHLFFSAKREARRAIIGD
jgi:hypothetical protein